MEVIEHYKTLNGPKDFVEIRKKICDYLKHSGSNVKIYQLYLNCPCYPNGFSKRISFEELNCLSSTCFGCIKIKTNSHTFYLSDKNFNYSKKHN